MVDEAVKEKKFRLQLDFTDEAIKELEELKKASRASNRAEVIRYALRVLDWVLEQRKEGNKILVERKESEEIREMAFPFLK